ncbi:MAG: DinB family protein [Candidatus Kapabacteria bacterium]|jgi:uncharacterized damage-inducible protein DinB|nr:DinB family protein [Candidatus Kapabacteria bacterium]
MNAIGSFEQLLQYGVWSMARHFHVLESAGLLSDERVQWILGHVVNARILWLERLRDGVVRTSIDRAMAPSSSIEHAASETDAWIQWLRNGGEDLLDSIVSYRNLRGEEFHQPVHEVISHVVNHTTHHLHELSMIERAAGVVPPVTDLIAFFRQ